MNRMLLKGAHPRILTQPFCVFQPLPPLARIERGKFESVGSSSFPAAPVHPSHQTLSSCDSTGRGKRKRRRALREYQRRTYGLFFERSPFTAGSISRCEERARVKRGGSGGGILQWINPAVIPVAAVEQPCRAAS